MISRFSRLYPRVTLHIEDVPSPAVQLAELRNRKYDFVLARMLRPFTDEDIHVETLFNDHVVIAASGRSRWARRRKVDLADLAEEPWTLTPHNSWVYSHIAEAFGGTRAEIPKPTLLTLSVPLRCNLPADSNHITAFAKSVIRLQAPRYGLKALPVDLPHRP